MPQTTNESETRRFLLGQRTAVAAAALAVTGAVVGIGHAVNDPRPDKQASAAPAGREEPVRLTAGWLANAVQDAIPVQQSEAATPLKDKLSADEYVQQRTAFMGALVMHESTGRWKVLQQGAPAPFRARGGLQYSDNRWHMYGGYAHADQAPAAVQLARGTQDVDALASMDSSWSDVAEDWAKEPPALQLGAQIADAMAIYMQHPEENILVRQGLAE